MVNKDTSLSSQGSLGKQTSKNSYKHNETAKEILDASGSCDRKTQRVSKEEML